jgi:membrane protease YdiL (CAAX protease family)
VAVLLTIAASNLIVQELILRSGLGKSLAISLFCLSSFTVFYLILPLAILSGFNFRLFLIALPTAAVPFTISYLVESGIAPFYFSVGHLLYLIPLAFALSHPHRGAEKPEDKSPSTWLLHGGLVGFLLGGNLFFIKVLTEDRFFPSLDVWVKNFLLALGWKAIPEEIFYRGLIFAELYENRKRFWKGALISSLFYSLSMVGFIRLNGFPLSWGLWAYLVLAGIAFAVLYRADRSIIPPIAANVVFSAIYLLVNSG